MINLTYRHRCMNFDTTGKIIYDPDRKGMKANNEYWMVIDIDDEIAAYYRFQFLKHFGITLDKTAWNTHISVLKNYSHMNKDIPWKYRDEEIVEVKYGHELFWNEEHVWVNCYSEAFFDIRNHYGVTKSGDQGHITIGRFKNYQVGFLRKFGSYKND